MDIELKRRAQHALNNIDYAQPVTPETVAVLQELLDAFHPHYWDGYAAGFRDGKLTALRVIEETMPEPFRMHVTEADQRAIDAVEATAVR
jgi:hypothetical protein